MTEQSDGTSERQVLAFDDRPVLVVTCLDDPTADLVIAELYRRGVAVARFDTTDFPQSLSFSATIGPGSGVAGTLQTATRIVDLSRVRSVYWRRPTGYRFADLEEQDARYAEAESRHGLTGTLASLNCRYVNHPFHARSADYKPAQLAAAFDVGFTVPPTLVTNDPCRARLMADEHGPIVYKPLRGIPFQVDGEPRTIWVDEVEPGSLNNQVKGMMHLFQQLVPKIADLRVTVVGEQAFAVRIDSGLTDWRSDYDSHVYTVVDPPSDISAKMHRYLQRFQLTFGCFDFALDKSGEWVFLECNPNGQWGWLEPVTDLPITSAFADILEGSTDDQRGQHPHTTSPGHHQVIGLETPRRTAHRQDQRPPQDTRTDRRIPGHATARPRPNVLPQNR